MNKEEKDDFDALMRIAEFNIKQFNERRDYSWKITFGFWGAIFGSVAIISPNRENIPVWVVFLAGAIVILIHALWLYSVFLADQKDKILAFSMRNRAIKILNLEPPKDENDRDFWHDWSAQFQLIVTVFLAIVVMAIILLLK